MIAHAICQERVVCEPIVRNTESRHPMSDPKVEEIRARLAAAAKMPWVTQTSIHDDGLPPFTLYHTDEYDDPSDPFGLIQTEGDAEFIANAPTDIALLLTKLDEAERENANLRGVNRALERRCLDAQGREFTLIAGVNDVVGQMDDLVSDTDRNDFDRGQGNVAEHVRVILSRLLPSTTTEEHRADS